MNHACPRKTSLQSAQLTNGIISLYLPNKRCWIVYNVHNTLIPVFAALVCDKSKDGLQIEPSKSCKLVNVVSILGVTHSTFMKALVSTFIMWYKLPLTLHTWPGPSLQLLIAYYRYFWLPDGVRTRFYNHWTLTLTISQATKIMSVATDTFGRVLLSGYLLPGFIKVSLEQLLGICACMFGAGKCLALLNYWLGCCQLWVRIGLRFSCYAVCYKRFLLDIIKLTSILWLTVTFLLK